MCYINELVLPNLLPKVSLLLLVELSTFALHSSTYTVEGNGGGLRNISFSAVLEKNRVVYDVTYYHVD